MDYMQYLEWAIEYVPMVVTAAAALATITPNDKDNVVLKHINQILNLFGFNFGRATNKE